VKLNRVTDCHRTETCLLLFAKRDIVRIIIIIITDLYSTFRSEDTEALKSTVK